MKKYLVVLILTLLAVPSLAGQQMLLESSSLDPGYLHKDVRNLMDANAVKANANDLELYSWGMSTGIETVDEGNGNGWRLIGRDPDNYGNIGLGAVDLSYSNFSGESNGAVGPNSHAEGWGTVTGAELGLVLPPDILDAGWAAHAEGIITTAKGAGSHAEGYGSLAEGLYSHAEGYKTEALVGYSHAEGSYSVASGLYSHAEGLNTIAQNSSSHAAGKYNVGTSSETIHETGIGGNIVTRENAFEIYLNGRIRAPALTLALHDVPSSLTTKEYVDSKWINKTPATQTETCVVGEHAWDTDYIYVCTSTDYWERTAIAPW